MISDTVNDGPKYHHRGCRGVTLAGFTEKVLSALADNRRPNGRYFWVASEHVAKTGGARACELEDDPLYR
ncbi:hypothetical protein FSW04_05195 [Baekduia soli]|uniref:Uncharacterized protein n=1 Tax=Baekduia soli TaxID=496014 RepID=A0A5B8U1W6_9ACTN|nr:hypothetical protein [Baekduia soli]QEC47039.1 hypothetical protein FSW04_05195 [Baekduia soli]